MQTIETNHPRPSYFCWLSVIVMLIGLFLHILFPQQLWAQSNEPTVLPIPAADELVVVAGGYGATLYNADGTVVATASAGERLIASARSADNDWLLVRTGEKVEGWAQRATLLLFERITLKMVDLDVNAMNDAVAAAANVTDAADEQSRGTVDEPVDEPVDESDAAVISAPSTDGVENDSTGSNSPDAPATVAGVSALVRTGDQRLNVRSGPGTNYPVIAKVAPGATVTVIGQIADQRWLQIQQADLDDGYGWVAADFVALAAPIIDLPIVDAVNTNAATIAGTPAGASANTPAGAADNASDMMTPIAHSAGLHGKLVFTDRNGGRIYLYHLATGVLKQLTNGNDPALSPDGNWIVFTRGGGESGIYLIDSNGGNEKQIFGERELLRSPKWSPDGNWIVFSRGDEFNKCYLDDETGECLRFTPFVTEGLATGKDHIRKLARIDRNGDNYRDLAVVPDAVAPDWGNGGVVYQSAAGLQITQDTPEDNNHLLYFEIRRQYHQDPDWQPGGGRIVFQQRQGSHYEIFAINSDGAGLTALTRPVTALVDQLPSNVSPAWSPDGQSIVFLSNRAANGEAGAWRLWVMNADGSNQRPLPIDLPLHYDYALEQMVDWGP